MEMPPDTTKEYIWCTKLSKSTQSTQFEGREDGCMEQLVLKRACLGAGAKENERNLVQVTSFDHEQEKVEFCICSLRAENQEDVSLSDLTILPPAIFKLVEGSGPIHLVGNHMIMEEYDDEDSEIDYDSDMESEDISDEEEQNDKPKANAKQIKKKKDSFLDEEALEDEIESDEADKDMDDEDVPPEPKSASKKRKFSDVKAEVKTEAPEKKKKATETPKKKETPKTPLQQKENKAPQSAKKTPSVGEAKSALKKEGGRKKKTTSVTG